MLMARSRPHVGAVAGQVRAGQRRGACSGTRPSATRHDADRGGDQAGREELPVRALNMACPTSGRIGGCSASCSGMGGIVRRALPRVLKWVAPLICRGFVSEACEVDGAGGVEGFLGCAHRPGGGVDREPEGVG